MDLSRLLALGGDSPVLQALVSAGCFSASLRNLRLVSKELSLFALSALRSFTLTLKGGDKDTDVNRASLLQGAKLRDLTLDLQLTSECGWDM